MDLSGVDFTTMVNKLRKGQKEKKSKPAGPVPHNDAFYKVKIGQFLRPHKYHRLMAGQFKKKNKKTNSADGAKSHSQMDWLAEERVDNGSAIMTRLKTRLIHHKLSHASTHFKNEEATLKARYGTLRHAPAANLNRFCVIMEERMRTKALHLQFLQEDYAPRSDAEMFKEVIDNVKEAKDRLERETAAESEGSRKNAWSAEEEGEDSTVSKVLKAIEESKELRERLGWGDAGEEEEMAGGDVNDVDAPLDYVEAHQDLLRRTRELNQSVWTTLKKSASHDASKERVETIRGAWVASI